MKIAFQTLGCKLNYAETSTYARGFAENGWKIVPWTAGAEVYLINTCSVTEHAEKKARNLIRKLHRRFPEAGIIVTGCYAELRRAEIEAIEGVARVFGAAEKTSVVSETLRLFPPAGNADNGGEGPAGTVSGGKDLRAEMAERYRRVSEDFLPAFSTGERTRSFLKVQDGCNNFCAYCTIPYARGCSRNLPIRELIGQAERIAAQGVKEIVLTGVNIGDFGRSTGETFAGLLEALEKVEGIARYRISSIEPDLLGDELIDRLGAGGKFLPHFHIPLQTGSDSLLRAVGRKYDTALFADRIDRIRSVMERPGSPKVFFGIDVIVGLPGETDELFSETCRFLEERIRPAFLHLFPYSKRPGTRAASLPGQVQDRVKTLRLKQLEALSDRLHRDFLAANLGIREKVLWESRSKDGRMSGYTGNYIRMERPFEAGRIGCIEEVVIR